MIGFLLNIVLAFVWGALTGEITVMNLLIGYVIGFLILLFVRNIITTGSYTVKVALIFEFSGVVIWDILLANLNVAWHVITPAHIHHPRIVRIPLDARTDGQITFLANIISLTPGTLSLYISKDRKNLYIHALDVDDPDVLRRKIKTRLERRIMGLLT